MFDICLAATAVTCSPVMAARSATSWAAVRPATAHLCSSFHRTRPCSHQTKHLSVPSLPLCSPCSESPQAASVKVIYRERNHAFHALATSAKFNFLDIAAPILLRPVRRTKRARVQQRKTRRATTQSPARIVPRRVLPAAWPARRRLTKTRSIVDHDVEIDDDSTEGEDRVGQADCRTTVQSCDQSVHRRISLIAFGLRVQVGALQLTIGHCRAVRVVTHRDRTAVRSPAGHAPAAYHPVGVDIPTWRGSRLGRVRPVTERPFCLDA